jgi:hypothetical protein
MARLVAEGWSHRMASISTSVFEGAGHRWLGRSIDRVSPEELSA